MHHNHMHCIGDYLHTRTVSSDFSSFTEHYIYSLLISTPESTAPKPNGQWSMINEPPAKVFGQLVALGFDVAVFTPAPYQRHRL